MCALSQLFAPPPPPPPPPPSRYMKLMLSVPRFAMRLKSMQIKFTFQDAVTKVESALAVFNNAVAEVSAAARLRVCKNDPAFMWWYQLQQPILVEFLTRWVLPLGNALNAGNSRAMAVGVKLAEVNKLGMTKTADNKMTAFQFLAQTFFNKGRMDVR